MLQFFHLILKTLHFAQTVKPFCPSFSLHSPPVRGHLHWVCCHSLLQPYMSAPLLHFAAGDSNIPASCYITLCRTSLDLDMVRSKFNELQLTGRCHGSDYLIRNTGRGRKGSNRASIEDAPSWGQSLELPLSCVPEQHEGNQLERAV